MTGRRGQAACSAVNCSNRAKKGSGITFHPFPHSNEELMKKWLIAMRRAKFTPTKGNFLCSTHFEDKCFSTSSNGRRLLHSRAIPTKFNFPMKRPIRVVNSSTNSSTVTRSENSEGPPIYTAMPIVLSPPQQQVNPVRRAFLKDHCYSLPGLQKLKKSLDEKEHSSSITRSQALALSDAEQILGTALQERRLILNGAENTSTIVSPQIPTPEAIETPQSNPIQEHIDACVMKAVTPLEQQILHVQEVVSALTSQIAQQKTQNTVLHSRAGRSRNQSDNSTDTRREVFDWSSLLPVQPTGCTLPADEHEVQVLATRLAVSFSEIPAEAIAEQFQVHYILTQFAAWPSLPPVQRLATYRIAKMLYVAITKGWPTAIHMEQESQGIVPQSSSENVVRVPIQVSGFAGGKRSGPRGGLNARGRRGK